MTILLLCVFAFIFFTCIGFLLFHRLFSNKMIMGRRILPYLSFSTVQNGQGQEEDVTSKSIYVRLIQPIMGKLRLFAVGKMPKHKMGHIEKEI